MHENMDLISKEIKKKLKHYADISSKIIVLQGKQLERLLDIDVIANGGPFLNGKFGGQKSKQCKGKCLYVAKMV